MGLDVASGPRVPTFRFAILALLLVIAALPPSEMGGLRLALVQDLLLHRPTRGKGRERGQADDEVQGKVEERRTSEVEEGWSVGGRVVSSHLQLLSGAESSLSIT